MDERAPVLDNGHLTESPQIPGGEVVGQRVQPLPAKSQQPADPLLAMLEATLTNPEIDIEKLERLHTLYMNSQAEKARIEFEGALSEMQAELPVIDEKGFIRNTAGEKQSSYAYWADIKEAIKPHMAKYGFNIRHKTVQPKGEPITVIGTLGHRSGHTETAEIILQHDSTGSKNGVQAVGSSISYGQRYTAKELIGFVTKGDPLDDDGQAAGESTISDADQEVLKALCSQAGADIKKFLGHFKAASFADMPAAKFKKAKSMLEAKIAQRRSEERRKSG
jgi:hypothetical protein